eukprot:snap_masked-scaffold_50-processed-gene-1.64-mRNA-1 protein AED:1.00 eAED:1.00 QI:0/0/0/0/1/1/3/0/61
MFDLYSFEQCSCINVASLDPRPSSLSNIWSKTWLSILFGDVKAIPICGFPQYVQHVYKTKS